MGGGCIAATLAGVELRPSLQARGGSLVLATCGVRKTLAINHYVSALYVPRKASIQTIGSPKSAKAVRIHITNDRFLPGEVPSKWRKALSRAVSAQTLEQLDSMMQGLRRGDVVTITYLPKAGTSVTKNSEVVSRIAGHRAIDEILRTWAQDAPVATKLEQLVADNPC